MSHAFTRRSALRAAGGAAVSLAALDPLLAAEATSARRVPLARGGDFSSGVMSGDPGTRSITLWTRLGGVERDKVAVRVEIARDPGFRRVVASKRVATRLARDHTVKLRVGGLDPDERYWYRFETRDAQSQAGRLQTAPPPDSQRPVRFAFFSCQDYASGHYGAYERLTQLDPDVVICLGDYIYEQIFDGYGGVRPDTTGANKDGEVRTLEEYREKYRLYRTDPHLREMHRLIPFMAMWDDHEVEDNYAAGDPNADDFDLPRQRNGWRAFFEYMPNMQFKERRRTYRRMRYGKNAEFFLLDQRQYRDDQPCGDGMFTPCADSTAPRDYLGRAQMEWLKNRLSRTGARWKIIGNQLMIMPFDAVQGLPVVQDSWEGYQAERYELLSHIHRQEIGDVAFVTGDIHTFFAGDVLLNGRDGPKVGVELVGGSTTSPGTAQTIAHTAGDVLTPELVKVITDQLVITNPWFDYVESRLHGFAIAEADRDELRASFHASADVVTEEASRDVRQLQAFRVAAGTSDLQLA